MEDMDPNVDTEYSEDGAGAVAEEEDEEDRRRRFVRSNLCDKELDFTRRENELMRREIEIMRRENEFLRSTRLLPTAEAEAMVRRPETMMPKINLSNLKEMLPEFDGNLIVVGKNSYCW